MDRPEPTIAGEFFFDPADAIYADHFPGSPVVPGSLVIEAFMRAVRPVVEGGWRTLSVHNFRFRHFVSPGRYNFRVERRSAGVMQCALYDGSRAVVTGILSSSDAPC